MICSPACARRNISSKQAANLALGWIWSLARELPMAVPWPRSFPTGEGDVLAAVITAGKPFLLRATLHNGSAAAMDVKQFALDVPEGLEVRAVHGQGAEEASLLAMAAR